MDKTNKRIDVLLEWRDRAEAAGHAVPSVPDVMRIGAADELRPDGVVLDGVEPWAETIEHLLKQVRFGVIDPVSQLPDELGSPEGKPASEDPVLVALLGWHREQQKTDPRLRALKEHLLRNIAMAGVVTDGEIQQHLPGPLGIFAPAIAEVVAGAALPSPRAVAPPDPTPAEAAPTSERPGPARPGAPPQDSDLDELEDLELADYAYTVAEHPPMEIGRRVGTNGVVLTWPAASGPETTVLYRVVSAEGPYPPEDPQSADPLVVTEATRCVDPRPFRAPVRRVQVWRHCGASREDAAKTEPVLHAEVVVIAQVTDAYVGVDGSSVVGQWKVPTGVTSVEVLRVPAEQARRNGHSSSHHRLTQPRPFINNFVDENVQRGQTYVYELSIEVELGGSRLRSDPVKVDVEVPAVLEPVTNLRRVDHPDDDGVFDLHWTQPDGGEVRIYRTSVAPEAGVEERPVPESALSQARLSDQFLVRRPIVVTPGGEATMVGVSWPQGWTSAYLTPVTVLGDNAAVGPSLLALRLKPVRGARIVERTHRQMLTFAWPEGADTIAAYVGGPGQDAESAQRGEPEEITHDQYVRYGGMYFSRPLAPKGCSVHLVPVAYDRGIRHRGSPVSLEYPGLTRLRYMVRTERDGAKQPTRLVLQIISEYDHAATVQFVLVRNPERLPLHERDGFPLPVMPFGDPGAVGGVQFRPGGLRTDPGDAVWVADVAGLAGYVRLFVCAAPDRPALVALLDPDVRQLRVFPAQAGS